MPYDRSNKEFRSFEITYGLLDRKCIVQARSNLEAGLKFQNDNPGETMHEIEDIQCRKIKFKIAA